MRRVLVDAGWRVTEAADTLTTLELLADILPDVLLADADQTDGLDLLPRVRTIDEDVPLVLLADAPDLQTIVDTVRAGAFDCIPRPALTAEGVLATTDALLSVVERAGMHVARIRSTRAQLDHGSSRFRRLEEDHRQLTAAHAEQGRTLEAALLRAEQADRAKSAFLANMSHELRTPLNAILGYAELLGEDLADTTDASVQHDLDRIRGAGTHLLSLISDVLELARVEAGRADVFYERIDLSSVLQRVVDDLAHAAAVRGNTITIDAVPPGSVVTDVAKLTAVMDRIVGNANKFTSRGAIRLSAEHGPDGLVLRVSDTGIGISAEQKRHIFREFSQADASTTRRYGGTGLGLTIASRLIELLGGDIHVESEQGQGSTFVVEVPTPRDWTATGDPVASLERDPPGRRATLLLIDSDATLRRQMTTQLTTAGFQVLATASGVEGLRLARAQRPDVILLDVVLPDVDGWNLLMGFKRDPSLQDIPVVLVTLADDRTRGLAIGATDFLAKPIRRDALLATMRRVLPSSANGPILVVEDDDATRDVTVRMLKGEGYPVDSVADGRQALTWLDEHPLPSLILLDLMMPEIDGFHVITELQCRDDWKAIPVVVFTAMDVPPARLAFLERHVESVVQKGGYGPERMLEEVRLLIDRALGEE
jgi:signal transduction histidine kinase/DNA-binding LytR/AlgR family response regulator